MTRDPSPGADSGLRARAILLLGVAAAAFHLWAAGVAPFTALVQRPVHLALLAVLAFAGVGVRRREGGPDSAPRARVAAWLLAAAAVVSCLYLVTQHAELVARSGSPTAADLVLGGVAVVVVLELARRTTGWGLVVVAVGALAYALAGPWLPGVLAHRGYGPARLVEHLYLSTEGIWGVPLGVSADFVYLFILFGALLDVAGGGALLIALADRVAGRSRGGPAKTAAVASAFMGSLSGSAVANVVTTGSFTIPLMRRAGFRPHFAAAIEAAASTGGQLMPPVMGAGAFILATWTSIPYARVAAAAAVPALLYYVALLMAIHFRAGRMGIEPGTGGGSREAVAGRLHLLLPLGVVVAFLATGRSPMRAAFWGVVSATVLGAALRPRLDRKDVSRAVEVAARGAVQVAAACAAAGIVVGVASLTGIGLRLSGLIVTLSGGHLLPALGLTALGSIVLGMGLPTTAAYVVLAALGAPALVELGVPLLAAHLFIFYFGCISNVTPPVSLAAYAAAGLAGAPPVRTALYAMVLAGAGFLVPFLFVYAPPLLLDGSPVQIALSVLTAAAGVTALAAAAMGWAGRPLGPPLRALLAAGALGLILLLAWTTPTAIAEREPGASSGAGAIATDAETGAGTFLSIGTGGTGGVYYPLGGALAARLSTAGSGWRVTAEVTGGSVENLNRIRAGQVDLGFALGGPVYEAYTGGQGFATPFADLRIVAPLYPNLTHVLVRTGRGIASLADARDRRISVGSPGSGTEQVARQLLEAYGLTYDDVDEQYLSFAESASALRDGALDVAILSVGYPASAVLEALTAGGVELLAVDRTAVERLRERYPYHSFGEIPSGVYPGVESPIPTAAMMNWVVARADLDPTVAGSIVNILGGRGVPPLQAHEMASQIDLSALADAPVPLHPGTRAAQGVNR